jgi:hypothetical protein
MRNYERKFHLMKEIGMNFKFRAATFHILSFIFRTKGETYFAGRRYASLNKISWRAGVR